MKQCLAPEITTTHVLCCLMMPVNYSCLWRFLRCKDTGTRSRQQCQRCPRFKDENRNSGDIQEKLCIILNYSQLFHQLIFHDFLSSVLLLSHTTGSVCEALLAPAIYTDFHWCFPPTVITMQLDQLASHPGCPLALCLGCLQKAPSDPVLHKWLKYG